VLNLKGIAMLSHPPVIIPEIAKGREKEADQTIRGIKDVALNIAKIAPEVIVCITPHGNVFQDTVSVVYETKMTGNLEPFGGSDVHLEKECDMDLLNEMHHRFGENNCEALFLNQKTAEKYAVERTLDHGCLVPLYYVDKVYTKYKIVHITIGMLSLYELYRTGRILREAIEAVGKSTVILASADLSHALKNSGPYTYHEKGPVFDQKIVQAIEEKQYFDLLTMGSELYDPAKQCGLRPIVMALGTTDSIATKSKVYSYEAPFGVGYLAAWITFDLEQADPIRKSLLEKYQEKIEVQYQESRAQEDALIKLARETLEMWVLKGRKLSLETYLEKCSKIIAERLQNDHVASFVSFYRAGNLRGCIGTLSPMMENLGEEVIHNAIEAAAYDPRFLAIEKEELQDIDIVIDLLNKPRQIDSTDELNPAVYGIIIEKGLRKAVLLPDLPAITTVKEQLEVAKAKAGIMPGEEGIDLGERLIISKFTVERHGKLKKLK